MEVVIIGIARGCGLGSSDIPEEIRMRIPDPASFSAPVGQRDALAKIGSGTN